MSTHQAKADEFDSQVIAKMGKKLYLKPEKADFYFVVESTGERIPAHKILLSSASDVFEAMLYGSLKEEGDIRIVDASAEAFKEFLQFFYFNKVKLSNEHVAELMYLGKKYNVEECLRLSTNLLKGGITTENVVSAFGLALTYEQKELQQLCELEIKSKSTEIFLSAGFLECDRQLLSHILNMDYFTCSEVEVFEACMSWVRASSKQDQLNKAIVQAHLGDLFYAIRFGSMSMDEFVKLVPLYGYLFSAEDYTDILQTIAEPERQPKLFKGCRRFPVWNVNNVINCSRCIKRNDNIEDHYHIKAEEITTFSTNKAMLLGHFHYVPLFEAVSGKYADAVKNVKVVVLADSKEIHPEFIFDYLYEENEAFVDFPKPIVIKPEVRYKIRLTFPSNGYKVREQLKSTVNLKDGVVVQFHNDHVVNGKVTGIIYRLGLNRLD